MNNEYKQITIFNKEKYDKKIDDIYTKISLLNINDFVKNFLNEENIEYKKNRNVNIKIEEPVITEDPYDEDIPAKITIEIKEKGQKYNIKYISDFKFNNYEELNIYKLLLKEYKNYINSNDNEQKNTIKEIKNIMQKIINSEKKYIQNFSSNIKKLSNKINNENLKHDINKILKQVLKKPTNTNEEVVAIVSKIEKEDNIDNNIKLMVVNEFQNILSSIEKLKNFHKKYEFTPTHIKEETIKIKETNKLKTRF